jgi:hypothetical protein
VPPPVGPELRNAGSSLEGASPEDGVDELAASSKCAAKFRAMVSLAMARPAEAGDFEGADKGGGCHSGAGWYRARLAHGGAAQRGSRGRADLAGEHPQAFTARVEDSAVRQPRLKSESGDARAAGRSTRPAAAESRRPDGHASIPGPRETRAKGTAAESSAAWSAPGPGSGGARSSVLSQFEIRRMNDFNERPRAMKRCETLNQMARR